METWQIQNATAVILYHLPFTIGPSKKRVFKLKPLTISPMQPSSSFIHATFFSIFSATESLPIFSRPIRFSYPNLNFLCYFPILGPIHLPDLDRRFLFRFFRYGGVGDRQLSGDYLQNRISS